MRLNPFRLTPTRQPLPTTTGPQDPALGEARDHLKILKERLIAQETFCNVLAIDVAPGSMAENDLRTAQQLRDTLRQQVTTLENNIEQVQSGRIDASRVLEGL